MTKTTLLLFVIFIVSCAPRVPQDATVIDEYPPIFPDYADSIVVPPNIAPLNFILPDSMVDAVVVIAARHCGLDLDPKTNIVIKGNDIRIPIKKWRKFCIPTIAPNTTSNEQQPQAEQSTITITVYHNNKQYKPLHWLVSKDSIDPYIVYRLVLPTDGVYQTISLNERTLSDFNTRPILQNTATKNSCFNCHSFQNYNGDKMILQLRNPRGLFIKDENGARTIIPPSINNTTDENVA
ncbi:MAG: hypothetical protein LBF01_01105, partial [Bacteroidales bacterium]|nr:hypothetical protein [Bacteroidales bacterium]